ncbi:hypothetical protein SOHN41_00968 [Shewanella sp. HN-41]|nr:hypothetical protein SOHN41_00968 [Shewanella sp. HN-41]
MGQAWLNAPWLVFFRRIQIRAAISYKTEHLAKLEPIKINKQLI